MSDLAKALFAFADSKLAYEAASEELNVAVKAADEKQKRLSLVKDARFDEVRRAIVSARIDGRLPHCVTEVSVSHTLGKFVVNFRPLDKNEGDSDNVCIISTRFVHDLAL